MEMNEVFMKEVHVWYICMAFLTSYINIKQSLLPWDAKISFEIRILFVQIIISEIEQ